MELGLCDKLLLMDERNFHCWNYRLWVAETLLSEIESRADDKSAATVVQEEFMTKECDMAEQMIRKNFSNYSAWHYRGKLLPKIYASKPDIVYAFPLERIKSDLEMLKHAFYTDP